jgi:tetratricopeptide (TPR) repeat protein
MTAMSQVADKLLTQALQARREGRLQDAERDLVDAVDLCRKADVPTELAAALTALGQIERDLHHLDSSRQHYEEAVALYRAQSDHRKLAHTLRHLGDIHRSEQRTELAESCYGEALTLYRSDAQTPPLELANAIRGLAILKHDSGAAGPAKLLWTEARDLYAIVNVKEGVAESSRRLALLSQRSGELK